MFLILTRKSDSSLILFDLTSLCMSYTEALWKVISCWCPETCFTYSISLAAGVLFVFAFFWLIRSLIDRTFVVAIGSVCRMRSLTVSHFSSMYFRTVFSEPICFLIDKSDLRNYYHQLTSNWRQNVTSSFLIGTNDSKSLAPNEQ